MAREIVKWVLVLVGLLSVGLITGGAARKSYGEDSPKERLTWNEYDEEERPVVCRYALPDGMKTIAAQGRRIPNLETDFAIFCQQEGADLEIHLYSRNVAGEISAIGCYDYDFDKIIASMGSKVCYEKENMLCARGCEGAVE